MAGSLSVLGSGWLPPGGRTAPDAHRGPYSHGGSARACVQGGHGRRTMACAPEPLPVGPDARAPGERGSRRDGCMAAVWADQLPNLVGVGDADRPRRASGTLSPCARHNCGHGGGLAAPAGGRGHRRHHRARLVRARVAADRAEGGGLGHRPAVHPRNRVPDAGGDRPGGGGDG